MRIHLLAMVAAIGLGGCLTSIETQFREGGLGRAAFELQCPREQLQVQVLVRRRARVAACTGSQVGVTGCGKTAVYVCAFAGVWVNHAGTRN